MAITKTATHGANVNTAAATTAVTHTVTANSLVVAIIQFASDIPTTAADAATPMSVSGTAMTWTKVCDTCPTLFNDNVRTAIYVAYSNGAGSRTFTHTKGNASAINRRLSIYAVEGADTTLSVAVPAGNRISTTRAAEVANVSRSITPAGAGSMILGAIGDWNQVNAFSALTNNTLINTVNVAGQYTGTIVEPTTNPLSSGSAFTWGANCTGGQNTYAVIEIVPAAGGGSDTNISPAASQLVVSGTAPSVVQDIRRDLPQGNLALSSVPPTVSVSAHQAISPARGDLVISSAAPAVAVSQNSTISPAKAELVLSSAAPAVVRTANVSVQPARIDLIISSAAPSVALTTGVNASPAAQQLVISTAAPTVSQTTSANISPAAAQLVLSAAAPTVSAPANVSISPARTDLVITGTAPAVVQNVKRDPLQGNLTLSSSAPTVVRTEHRNISPAAAQLALSSLAPGVQAGGSMGLQPAAANLALSASAPAVAVTANHGISPPAANLSFSSAAPARVTDVRRDPPQGNLVLTGTAPSVNAGAGQARSPAAAALILTGTAPTVTIDFRLSPAAAQLALSRTAPSVVQDNPREIPSTQLTVSSAAPTVSVTTSANILVPSANLVFTGRSPSVVANFVPRRFSSSIRRAGIPQPARSNVSDAVRAPNVSTRRRF